MFLSYYKPFQILSKTHSQTSYKKGNKEEKGSFLSSFGESNSCFSVIEHSVVWSHEDITQDPAFYV